VRRRADARPLVVAAAYVAAMAFFIWVIADRSVGYGSDLANWLGLAALTALHLATGWGIGRWWAVLLPLLAIPISVPAGYPARTEPELWIGIAYVLVPAGTVLIALAIAFRRLGWPPGGRA
jgi:peptidoglycan/LPS O-acetylase OafA/YrhL